MKQRTTRTIRFRLIMVALALLGVVGLGALPKATAYTCPCSIWGTGAPAGGSTANDNGAVELGVKFRSDVAGTVSGIRFYKSTQNTGTHRGNLWTTSGTQLATATFTNETASGWQTVTFANPVSIAANTTYVASYFAPNGRYTATNNGLTNAVDNAPLHALASSASGGNGVYKYNGTSTFPNATWQNSNYWVDVVFNATTVPDTTPPTVTANAPANGATNLGIDIAPTATFNEELNASTVTSSSVLLTKADTTPVAATVTYNSTARQATITPSAPLENNTQYVVTVRGGIAGVKDVAGNALAADYTWSLTTAPLAPSNGLEQGFGGPVLVITSASKPFSKYYAEILRAEGISSFTSADLSAVTAATLNQYDVVILGDMPLTNAQVTTLSTWVTNGGNLIAMRPDKKLASLLGLTDQSSTLTNAYMLTNTTTEPGAGLPNQTMQFHGTADNYTATSGTSTVATLYSSATTATSAPAVTVRSVGSNGGQAAAFTYDLARSVVYTRQGNPAWQGQERNGDDAIRSNDLFFGAKTGDVQSDWVNLGKVAIPQADEQQRLLTKLMGFMNQDKKPLPKLWYFPKGVKAVVVMSGDDHTTASGTKDSFDMLKANSPAGCSVANWECFRSTSWAYTNIPMNNAEAAAYAADGFDIGAHLTTGGACAPYTAASLDQVFTNGLSDFQGKFTSLPAQKGNRTHCAVWSDWATQPKVELAHGIRWDMNYYYWPGTWVQDRPGFMNGSGLPMRFGDLDGSMIDVYQQASHVVDETNMAMPGAINTLLDRAMGPEGYYGAIGTHYGLTNDVDDQLMNAAKARGIPLVSGQQMLDWTDGRNNSYFSAMTWSGNNLTFTAHADSRTGTMLRGMLPLNSVKGVLQGVTRNGTPVSFTVETIKGTDYAFFPVSNGAYVASYATDTIAPTITATTPASGANNVNPATNVTATFSEAMDASTVSGGTFELRDSSNALVPAAVTYDIAAKTATLDPTANLQPNATYTASLKGGTTDPRLKDISGNALASTLSWSFVTSEGVPYSLWSSAAPVATVATDDPALIELGTRFTADQNGKIKSIRFYKGINDAATHTVTLWTSAGTALATATTSSETATGWQVATFATPVNITASTTYVASYRAPAGNYVYSYDYFTNPYVNAPLRTPANAGVYKYGAGFPTDTYRFSNYWVDVVYLQQ